MFGNDDSVLLCITHFYVDLVCFSIKKTKNLFLDWYVIFSKADSSTNNTSIQKHGIYIQIGVKVRQSMYLVMIEILTNVTWLEHQK